MKYLLLLVTLLACQSQAPEPKISGSWNFTGTVQYSDSGPTCSDTMTMVLTQDPIRGQVNDWHFACNGSPSTDTVPLVAVGNFVNDSLKLYWFTLDTFAPCAHCLTLTMQGLPLDSIMSGWYRDFLGGSGFWTAKRVVLLH